MPPGPRPTLRPRPQQAERAAGRGDPITLAGRSLAVEEGYQLVRLRLPTARAGRGLALHPIMLVHRHGELEPVPTGRALEFIDCHTASPIKPGRSGRRPPPRAVRTAEHAPLGLYSMADDLAAASPTCHAARACGRRCNLCAIPISR